MTKEQLESWFATAFWPAYREMVRTPRPTKWTAGKRGTALTGILKLKPSEEIRTRIMDSIEAQTRTRRKHQDRDYRNRMASTWINQRGWEDDADEPAISSDSAPIGTMICHECQDKDGTIRTGPAGALRYLCLQCWDKQNPNRFQDQLDLILKRMVGVIDGQTKAEFAARCREAASAPLGAILSGATHRGAGPEPGAGVRVPRESVGVDTAGDARPVPPADEYETDIRASEERDYLRCPF